MAGDWTKNRQEGFILKLIIFIVAVVLVMNYFHLSVSDLVNWISDIGKIIVKIFSWRQ